MGLVLAYIGRFPIRHYNGGRTLGDHGISNHFCFNHPFERNIDNLYQYTSNIPHMDNSPDGVSPDLLNSLSYDDTIAYEEQLPTNPSNDPEQASLANRIGSTKVYLLAESSVNRVGKVRW